MRDLGNGRDYTSEPRNLLAQDSHRVFERGQDETDLVGSATGQNDEERRLGPDSSPLAKRLAAFHIGGAFDHRETVGISADSRTREEPRLEGNNRHHSVPAT